MSDEINVTSGDTAAPPSAPAASPVATPQAPAPVAATPATPQAPATPGAPEGYVPSFRLREQREAYERRMNESVSARDREWQSRYDQLQNQVRTLMGFQPPPNPEVKAVRDQFGNLYPGLSKLEDRANDVEELLGIAKDLRAQQEHYWVSHGQRTMDRLYGLAEKSIGTQLTDEARSQLHASFAGFVQSSPELANRYANDPSIVEDFWKVFTSSFIDPARRVATTTVVGRAAAATPQDAPSGSVPPSAPPKMGDLDDRVAKGWSIYNNKG